jgi:chlorinating enzyme
MHNNNQNHSLKTFSANYFKQGFSFAHTIFNQQQATNYLTQLEQLELQLSDKQVGHKAQLNYPYTIFQFANEIVRHPVLLDYVEQLLGPDIMVWGATFFIKEPHTSNYVSWHQDLKYWGLNDSDAQVSAWLALSDVNIENGCMKFLPATHKGDMLEHVDTFSEQNVLTRGQEAVVDNLNCKPIDIELKPGQVSFHHGKLLHSSAPNTSNIRRVGLAINYISTSVKQTNIEQDYAMLVRGTDKYGHFIHTPAPKADLSADAMLWHERVLNAQNKVIYK